MSAAMKHGLTFILFLATTFVIAASTPTERAHDLRSSLTAGPAQCAAPESDADELLRAKHKGCYWDGSAPFCAGQCKPGDILIRRSKFGDGARCWTGTKAYCCPPSPTDKKVPDNEPSESTSTKSSKTKTAAPKPSTSSASKPAPTTPIPSQPRPPQVPFPGEGRKPSAEKKKGTSRKPAPPSRKKVQPPRKPTVPPRKQAPPKGKKVPPPVKQAPTSGSENRGGSRKQSPKLPVPPAQGPSFPTQTPIPPAEQSDLEDDEHEEDGNGYVEIAKDILSGFKDLTKLNFMGHFGEFGAMDDSEDAEEGNVEEEVQPERI